MTSSFAPGRSPGRFVPGLVGVALLWAGVGPARAGAGRDAVAVLIYHHFVSDQDAARKPGLLDDLTMSRSQFEAQLELLKQRSGHPITAMELYGYLKGQAPLPPRSFLVTIDDGYESIHRIAWPVLKERGVPAAIGLMVKATEDPERWRASHPGSTPHLTWGQIAEMLQPVKVGPTERTLISIESHTYDRHENLRGRERKLPPDRRTEFERGVLDDLKLARETIQKRTGLRESGAFLIWPHGGATKRLLEVARQAGHLGTFTILGDAVRPGSDPMAISRIHAGSGVRSIKDLERALDNAGWGR
ncbi:MAG: polysaccharide deacetylase family protein [Candidatus Riflebacteria bacterium]|nr:polysaccharide deacetylase family protein [Candidatus Riflebacteria bacterium]